MTWGQSLLEIESREFAANLNLASGIRSFFAMARNETAVKTLFSAMLESGEAREDVLGRIHDLSGLAVDPRYENPKDTPLAVLLYLTAFAAPGFASVAADLVDRAPQCWYAKKLARMILMPSPLATGNSVAVDPKHHPYSTKSVSDDMLIIINPAVGGVSRWDQQRPILATSPNCIVTNRPEVEPYDFHARESETVSRDPVMQ